MKIRWSEEGIPLRDLVPGRVFMLRDELWMHAGPSSPSEILGVKLGSGMLMALGHDTRVRPIDGEFVVKGVVGCHEG